MARDLSDTARTILAEAASRPDLHLLPVPATLKAPPVVIRKTISMLIRTGLATKVPADPGEPIWEQTEGTTPVTLVVTPAGLAAIGIEGEAATTPAEPPAPTASSGAKPRSVGKPGKAAPRGPKANAAAATAPKTRKGPRWATSGAHGPSGGRSKQDTCIILLRRGNGASIPEMMTATGWQSHSVRGFMSGALKKRLRLDIISEKGKSGDRSDRWHGKLNDRCAGTAQAEETAMVYPTLLVAIGGRCAALMARLRRRRLPLLARSRLRRYVR